MGTTMEVTNEALEVIGRYVRGNLGTWIREAGVYPAAPPAIDPELRERTVRVEDELKAQRELMKIGFDRVDQRFEQVDKRFEQVDKRFEEMRSDMNTRFEETRSDMNTRFQDMRADTNKRFEEMHTHSTRWNVFLSMVMSVIAIVLAYGTFFR